MKNSQQTPFWLKLLPLFAIVVAVQPYFLYKWILWVHGRTTEGKSLKQTIMWEAGAFLAFVALMVTRKLTRPGNEIATPQPQPQPQKTSAPAHIDDSSSTQGVLGSEGTFDDDAFDQWLKANSFDRASLPPKALAQLRSDFMREQWKP
jgi:hypothetical protein